MTIVASVIQFVLGWLSKEMVGTSHAPDMELHWSIVDGIDAERFQVHALLLAICKVHESSRDVQWNGWVVGYLPSTK